MAVREILKMGNPRLLRVAKPVTEFDTDELHLLVSDLLDTMAAANGAGLAAPQIGVDLQVVIFGSGEPIARYPDAPPVPRKVLVNPVITPLREADGSISAGVSCQYCGRVGSRIAKAAVRPPVAWQLYLPQEWADDPTRREKAGIPNDLQFATKG